MSFADPLIVSALLAALAYLPLANRPPSLPRSALKTAPLLLLAAAARAAEAPAPLTLALLLSALGDLALSREGRAAFLSGLSAFALAHLAYVALFLNMAPAPLLAGIARHPAAALAMLLLAASSEVWLAPHAGPLRWPVRAYVLAITAMGLAALTTGSALPSTGAALFILSDFILALRMFRIRPGTPASARAGRAVWALYIAGQSLILLGGAP